MDRYVQKYRASGVIMFDALLMGGVESVAHLLVMLNFSSNFLIYCSVSAQFKARDLNQSIKSNQSMNWQRTYADKKNKIRQCAGYSRNQNQNMTVGLFQEYI